MKSLSHEQRSAIQKKITQQLQGYEISLGEAVKIIRTEIYGFTQIEFAQLCRISDKTVRDIENGRTDPRLSIIERMLNMGGLGLVAAPKINYVRSANPLENTNNE